MRRLSSFLIYAGGAVCLVGAAGYLYGAWANLSASAVRAIAMTLPFVIGGLLLVVGAMVGRAARREQRSRELQ
jgi:hypothetical protein